MSETYSNIQSVNTETINAMKESVLPAANQEVLDKLGDSNGSLTYDGKAVGGRQTDTVTIADGDFSTEAPSEALSTIFTFDEVFPVNSEIVSIELNSGSVDSPNWVDLRDMMALYPRCPYSIIYNRFCVSNALGGYFLASLVFPLEIKNELITALDNYSIPQIRVTYYI